MVDCQIESANVSPRGSLSRASSLSEASTKTPKTPRTPEVGEKLDRMRRIAYILKQKRESVPEVGGTPQDPEQIVPVNLDRLRLSEEWSL